MLQVNLYFRGGSRNVCIHKGIGITYTNIDGKYDATLIAKNLTTYDFTEGSTEKIGYKALIECLPSWADYRNVYPQIEWSVVDDYANNYKITGLTDSDGRQFQAELECGNMTDTVVRVRAVIALSADIKITREIDITIPPLKTVVTRRNRIFTQSVCIKP